MRILYKNNVYTTQNRIATVTEVNKALKMVQLITGTAKCETTTVPHYPSAQTAANNTRKQII